MWPRLSCCRSRPQKGSDSRSRDCVFTIGDTEHVLGMVKRHLDMNGAKGPKLELDFLRLVYAVKELRLSGNDSKGYLLVMTPSIAQRVAAWQSKYQAGESVVVETAQFSQEQFATIRAEVRANIDGMVAGTVGEDVAGRSDATAGAQIGEELLRQLIETREWGVNRSFNEREFPFGIRWDYYGTDELGYAPASSGSLNAPAEAGRWPMGKTA